MKFQYETLIFTGRGIGRLNRKDANFIGVDPDYFYLGSLNRDRTVAATIIELCNQYSYCTAYEVHARICYYTCRLIGSGKFYKEFPDTDADFEYMSLEDVKRHMNSVVYRSRASYSKFIPRGIARVPNTEYVVYSGMRRQNAQPV